MRIEQPPVSERSPLIRHREAWIGATAASIAMLTTACEATSGEVTSCTQTIDFKPGMGTGGPLEIEIGEGKVAELRYYVTWDSTAEDNYRLEELKFYVDQQLVEVLHAADSNGPLADGLIGPEAGVVLGDDEKQVEIIEASYRGLTAYCPGTLDE